MEDIPDAIRKLEEKRDALREAKKFAAADNIRMQIEARGYEIGDTPEGTCITKKRRTHERKPREHFLVLFGSGETASSGRSVHEYVLGKMGKDNPRIVLVSTPAGFQPNVRTVYEEIADFFRERLQNFHPEVVVCYANTKEEANEEKHARAVENADYIFTGAGSPTYAVKNLKGTLLYRAIKEQVRRGATLSIASAATAAFSHYCLPVYEIYKAGEPLRWIRGLQIYGRFLHPMTIIPHFNNNEGGEKHDTSRAWMGKIRFQKLIEVLPSDEKILGIDEHTALVYNLQTGIGLVYGKGSIYEIGRHGEIIRAFAAGKTIHVCSE